MPAPAVPGPLDGTGFKSRTSTPPTFRAEPTGCLYCGSQLAGPYQGVRFIGRRAMRVWACRRGHSRRLPFEVAAADDQGRETSRPRPQQRPGVPIEPGRATQADT